MKQKIFSSFLILSITFFQTPIAFAQLDTVPPPTDTTVTAPPPPEPEPGPVVEPTPEPEPDPTPIVEEIIEPSDTAGPAFISIATVSAGETESSIVWTTDEISTGHIEYGPTASYGQSTPNTSPALEHSRTITGLTPGTLYHYRIVAQDESGNVSYSEDRTLETSAELVAADNVPPEISEIDISNITTSGATISWVTDELAQGKVEYGTTENYGSQTPLATDYAINHSTIISNLSASTLYHYRIRVIDEAGNTFASPDETLTTDMASSTEQSLVTKPEPIFIISETEAARVSTSTATITWTTSEGATSQVLYGTSGNYSESSLLTSSLQTSHSVKLTGLTSGTVYLYKVVSKNAAGQAISKSDFELTTLYRQVVVDPAPTISNVQIESVGTSTVSILWDTNERAAGELRYGTTAYEQTDGGHTKLLTAHRHTLSNLTANTTYNFQAIVWDEAGNESIYENMTFTTERVSTTNTGTPTASTPASLPIKSSGGVGGSSRSFTTGSSGNVRVAPLDAEALFMWNKVPETSKIETVIVKKAGNHPATPFDGTIVYRGTSGQFADTGLSNNATYYYSIFRVDKLGNYSRPKEYTVVPKAGINQTKVNIVPAVVQRTPIYTFDQTLKPGDTNRKVAHLQVLLASEPNIYPQRLITGYYGQLTSLAIARLQAKYKLPASGVADRATLDKLEELSTVEHVTPFVKLHDYWDRNLVKGMSGEDVSLLQSYLVKLKYYPEALVTGFFGPLTEKAVITFQKAQAIIPAVGYFGPVTQKRLTNIIKLQGIKF